MRKPLAQANNTEITQTEHWLVPLSAESSRTGCGYAAFMPSLPSPLSVWCHCSSAHHQKLGIAVTSLCAVLAHTELSHQHRFCSFPYFISYF